MHIVLHCWSAFYGFGLIYCVYNSFSDYYITFIIAQAFLSSLLFFITSKFIKATLKLNLILTPSSQRTVKEDVKWVTYFIITFQALSNNPGGMWFKFDQMKFYSYSGHAWFIWWFYDIWGNTVSLGIVLFLISVFQTINFSFDFVHIYFVTPFKY